jgi:hypothetical protein
VQVKEYGDFERKKGYCIHAYDCRSPGISFLLLRLCLHMQMACSLIPAAIYISHVSSLDRADIVTKVEVYTTAVINVSLWFDSGGRNSVVFQIVLSSKQEFGNLGFDSRQ